MAVVGMAGEQWSATAPLKFLMAEIRLKKVGFPLPFITHLSLVHLVVLMMHAFMMDGDDDEDEHSSIQCSCLCSCA